MRLSNLKTCLIIFSILLSLPVIAEEALESITRPGVFSFPGDIDFRQNEEGHIVFDKNSSFKMKSEITVSNNDIIKVRKTLELAKSKNSMVWIDGIVKDLVSIPVISVDPKKLKFVKVRPGDNSWGAFFTSAIIKNTSIEVYSTSSEGDIYIGMTCFGCSNSEMIDHIKDYEAIIKQAIMQGLPLIEVDLTKDSTDILVLDAEWKFYDPRLIGIQPFYFESNSAVPGGLKIFEFQKEPDTKKAKTNYFQLNSKDLLKEIFLDSGSVFFQPSLGSGNLIGILQLSVRDLQRQKMQIKGVVVVDGFRYFQILGSKSTIFQYNEFFHTFSRVIARAISEDKRVAVNLDRRGAMQMIMIVE